MDKKQLTEERRIAFDRGYVTIPQPKGEFVNLFNLFQTKKESKESEKIIQVEEKPKIPFYEGSHEWHEDLKNTPKYKDSRFIKGKVIIVGQEFICPKCHVEMPPLQTEKPQVCPSGDLGFLKMNTWTIGGHILVNEGVCVGKVSEEWLKENPIE